jgi:hypothetical protein
VRQKSPKRERAGVVSLLQLYFTGVCARVGDLDLFCEKMKNQNPDKDAGYRYQYLLEFRKRAKFDQALRSFTYVVRSRSFLFYGPVLFPGTLGHG